MSKKLPNIVLMVLDTVGAKHLSLYGYSRPTTPHLEKIARECTVYTRCFAPGCWTVPSHGSLFTGLYPSQHGAHEGRMLLWENIPHLASVLKLAGYRTLGISANALVAPASGLCPDFDEFHDLGAKDLTRILAGFQPTSQKPGEETLWGRLKKALTVRDALAMAVQYAFQTGRLREMLKTGLKQVTAQAAKVLRPGPLDKATPYSRKTLKLVRQLLEGQARRQEPFFLFINWFQAHQDYRPPLWQRRFSQWHDRVSVSPQRFYRRSSCPDLRKLVAKYFNLYDDEVRYLDSLLGDLWETLRSSPGHEDTVFIITSDHGEHFGEKGHYTHILSLYNELLWVPLIIRFPWGQAAPGVDPRLASLNDLYATILDLVDSPLPRPETSYSLLGESRRRQAVSQIVYPEMFGAPLADRQETDRSRGREFSPPLFAVMTEEGMKLIENRDGSLEVYNLHRDMAEEEDLAPTLTEETLRAYRTLLKKLKVETGFSEAAGDMLAQAERRASLN